MSIMADLASDPEVWAYFVVMVVAITFCFLRCKQWWPVLASLSFMSVTWWYIVRYTVEYKMAGGKNLFDDAYVDVVKDHGWAISSQLLTWVVVATVWAHQASLNYLLFGMLGAMSAAFVTWVPNIPLLSSPSPRYIPLWFFPCALMSLLCIYKLPHTLDAPSEFSFWLKALHLLIALPRLLFVFSPWQPVTRVDGRILYSTLAIIITVYHKIETPSIVIPTLSKMTDCQVNEISCASQQLHHLPPTPHTTHRSPSDVT